MQPCWVSVLSLSSWEIKPLVVIEEFGFLCSSFSQGTKEDESKLAQNNTIITPYGLISILRVNDSGDL